MNIMLTSVSITYAKKCLQSFGGRSCVYQFPIDRPADNKLDSAAIERDTYRLRIQLVVRSGDRRPHQLSAYSIEQIDAECIVDFEPLFEDVHRNTVDHQHLYA